MAHKSIFALVFALLLGALNGCVQHPSRIVCFGDSLTACGGPDGRYSDMLQKSLPEWEVINSGINGDTIGGGLARLEQDVLQWQPACVIIGLGANDYWQRQRSLAELQADYEKMVSQCCSAGAKVLLISCFGNQAIDPERKIDFHTAGVELDDYAAGLAMIEQTLIDRYHCGYVPDMQCSITPKGRTDLWSDSNHPNAAGNRIVADTILPELQKLLQE